MKWLAILLVALFTGCGTVRNLSRRWDYDHTKPGVQVYGGVAIDRENVTDGLRVLRRLPPEPAAIPAAGKVVANVADLPLSLVGDTLTITKCIEGVVVQHYARESARMDGTYEGDFEAFRQHLARTRVPELEVPVVRPDLQIDVNSPKGRATDQSYLPAAGRSFSFSANPGTPFWPLGTLKSAPWNASPIGSNRPPKCSARNASCTA